MGRAVQITVQLPEAVIIGFFIIMLRLTTVPFKALATLSAHSSDLDLITPDDPATGGNLHRSQFPQDFIFGSGTSAYQVEGAAWVDGKGPSIWDTWSHTPGRTRDGDTGDVAVDEYHRYEEDLDLLAAMNMDSYRFSIAWTRIFPNGTGPQVNMEGVAYYNRLIDYALSRGIIPMVVLYHWDLPQSLQDEYGGWESRRSIGDFAAYAEACFVAFGDRVKYWTTFNEPAGFVLGYGGGAKPPGTTANPSIAPYVAAHNVLLAHAAAVDIYRRLFQTEQNGVIGITLSCVWGVPLTDSTTDIEAAQRFILYQLGWFFDPIYFGDYPEVMRKIVGNRLPSFSEEQALQLKGSLDFIGLNHYTSVWVTQGPGPLPNQESNPSLDQHVNTTSVRDGIEIGPVEPSSWVREVPWGLYNSIKWISERYNAPIMVTENGMTYTNDVPLEDSLHDTDRIQYFEEYLSAVRQAIRDGFDVRGYFAWSLLDNFEWAVGYYFRFGLIYVDYNDGLKRYPKDSARWFSQILDRTRSSS